MHIPEWSAVSTTIDDKDKSFSKQIKAELVSQPLRSILSRLNGLASSDVIDAAICMGDFTTRGATEHIRPAVEVLTNLLVDNYSDREIAKFAVPGNHDVNKKEALVHGSLEKFGALEAALSEFGWPSPPIEDCLRYEVQSLDGLSLPVHLLNSSIGSWSIHLLPEPIQRELSEELIGTSPIDLAREDSEASAKLGLPIGNDFENREEQVYHQMDTPYFPVAALQSLKGFMDETSDDTVVVVAHHNILPQTTPRISHYSELLNSGQVREFFQNSKKTIVYLHGHIHDDPVERVTRVNVHNENDVDSEVIAISAPPIWKGFNEVCLFFDQDEEIFLVRVTEYRPDSLGTVGNFNDQKSRYIPVKARIEHLVTQEVQRVWAIMKDKRTLSWKEVTTLAERQSLSDDQVEHALLSLFCCSLVRIGHLGRDRERWRIKVNEAIS